MRPCCSPSLAMYFFHKEGIPFVWCLFSSIKQCISFCAYVFQEHVLLWMKPATTSLAGGILADLTRGKAELLAENALVRQPLIVLRRQIKRPVSKKTDRFLLVSPFKNGPDVETGDLPGSRRRRFSAGTVSSSACSGSTNPRHLRENRGFRLRPLR